MFGNINKIVSKLNFEVSSYYNLFSPCPSILILVWWQHYLSKGELVRLLMNQAVMQI